MSTPNNETFEIDHVLMRLQVVGTEKKDPIETYDDQKPYIVRAVEASKGTIKGGLRLVEPVSAVFLAGGSFRFDLEKQRKQ